MSNEKSLNEQLAELCGLEQRGARWHWYKIGESEPSYQQVSDVLMGDKPVWNPTTDLNQLKMCYEAAQKDWEEKDWEEKNPQFRYRAHIHWQLKVIFGKEVAGAYDAVSDSELIDAWVKHPELVAQAILKAKGVS